MGKRLISKEEEIASRFKDILDILGQSDREGTRDTPRRYARFITEFVRRPKFRLTCFEELDVEEMVIQNGIPVASLCEHHTLPFFGTATVAIVPNGKTIAGLSKFARVAEHFARGLQNQERITRQVGEFLFKHPVLKPKGVGVSIRCVHTCMTIRGAKAHGASTTTQYLAGCFKEDAASRAEFLKAVEHEKFYQ